MDFAIIAAGEGSRLRVGGVERCKPLVGLDGQPMIERLIGILDSSGGRRIAIVTNPAMPEVAEHLRGLSPRAELRVMEKSTGGSMESFMELSTVLDKERPFCLLTVDTVFRPEEFRRFIAEFEADTEADGYMAVTTYVADEKPLYVAADADDVVTGFLDEPRQGVGYVSGGIYALRPAALGVLAECAAAGVSRMRDFQRGLVAAGMKLKAWRFSKIIDVDRPADLDEAADFLRQPSPTE